MEAPHPGRTPGEGTTFEGTVASEESNGDTETEELIQEITSTDEPHMLPKVFKLQGNATPNATLTGSEATLQAQECV